ncbi:AMP-binding protein [Epidermidibacterium keratini]|uniref:AMP-binding protein n=1 Tax=Epidermidibacterium keratini TaxID=1891644 RepID=A0A7L4YSM8_9ACTN|nr:AMP-binding protein [Epidermidibacterium keratini]QHC02100.1 AMP-binding protein [Epidermidibacterium keratini]
MRVPLTLQHFIDRAETIYHDRQAIIDEPDQPAPPLDITWGELARRARAVKAGLDELGIGAGERVGIVSHNAGRMFELFYSVPTSGRIYVPINFRLRPDEVQFIVEHSGCTVLLVDEELAEDLKPVYAKHKFIIGKESDEALLRFDKEFTPWEPDEDAPAVINYTSGTTSNPKGVVQTHRSLWVNATTFAMHMGVNDKDVYLHTLPLFHCNGWGMGFSTTAFGVPQVMLRKVDGAEILKRVEQHGLTLACGAPAVWNMTLDAAKEWDGEIPGNGTMRIVVAGAAPPTKTIARVGDELGWQFNQIYGLTETAPLLTINRLRKEDEGKSSEEQAALLAMAGQPALGVDLDIAEGGEVLARSNVVMDRYWENPDATEEALEGGYFHTGDGGTIDDHGYLTISDRKKDIIITGGENVSSIEVEDVIFSHPDVDEVAVIGVPHEKWGETIKALVVTRQGAEVSEQDIIALAKKKLAGYKAPTSVEFRDEIPRTATGKVQKFKLRQPYWEGRDRQVN